MVVATELGGGRQLLLPDDPAPEGLAALAEQAVGRRTGAGRRSSRGRTWFLHAYAPPMRLVVVGAVHIAQALVPMAAGLGYGMCW